MSKLNWTGERLTTELADKPGTIEHLHRYALALQITANKTVVDIACGEGYGSNLISSNAAKVIGIDISEEAILHAKKKYKKSNLKFIKGSAADIPLPDRSADIVVSFETIEHHDQHHEMMAEIKRILTPGGVLIISSPDKDIYSKREYNNVFHIKELTTSEFRDLIKQYFESCKFFDQRFLYGSVIHQVTDATKSGNFAFFSGNYLEIENELEDAPVLYNDTIHNKPYFNIALASDSDLMDIRFTDNSFFSGISIYHNQIQNIMQSRSYRLGNLLLKPLSVAKAILYKLKK